jgi:hypothetical protein
MITHITMENDNIKYWLFRDFCKFFIQWFSICMILETYLRLLRSNKSRIWDVLSGEKTKSFRQIVRKHDIPRLFVISRWAFFEWIDMTASCSPSRLSFRQI